MNWDMKMVDDRDDKALETLFSSARDDRPLPSSEFMARLAADVVPPQPALPAAAMRPRPPWFLGLFTASGLSGAAALGVWIGFVMPDALDTFSFSTDDTVALSTFLPGADLGAAFSE